MNTVILPIIIILVLIGLNGLFVAAEFAIVASRRSRLQGLAKDGSSSAALAADIVADAEAQDRYIAVAQLGITLASVGLGMYGERSIAHWIEVPLHGVGVPVALSHTVGLVIAVVILTYFHVVIGEMIPKALALTRPEPTTLRVMPAMRLFGLGLRPLIWFLTFIGNGLLRLLGVPVSGHGRAYSTSELEQLVDESAEAGVVARSQHELINNIFSFGERTANQIMTHRTKVIGLELGDPPKRVRELIEQNGPSRLPVFEGDLDRIVGILHVRDFIRAQAEGSFTNLASLLRRAPRVPEHLNAETLLESFKRLKIHLAVVVNEYGGTAGVVTLEDLLEEVVGEIHDEYDTDEVENNDVTEIKAGELRVTGRALLAELNRQYHLELPTEASETVGGLVTDELGRAAKVGDGAAVAGVAFTVEEVSGLAVTRARLRFTPKEEPPKPKH